MSGPDGDAPTTGGLSTTQAVLAGRRLRPPRREDAEDARRLVDGSAWRDLCRALERSGEALLAADNPADEHTRAEGFRYLLGLLRIAIRQAADLDDPLRPAFVRIEDANAKWGAENADNHYLHAHVRSDLHYRIRGDRPRCHDFLIEVKEGFMHLGAPRNFATRWARDLQPEPDGRFEILASRERPTDPAVRNWLPLDPDATQIVIRQYFEDWEHEEPARFTIACLEGEGRPPERLGAAQMARRLDAAGHWLEHTLDFWSEWVPELRAHHDPARLAPARAFVGGADDIRYGNDLYRLAPGEALIFELEPPRAHYWHVQLCDLWFVTTDYANRITSINDAQAQLDADGRFRAVIAHEDPGVPNWLDTAGAAEGVLQYRYVGTQECPQPRITRVGLASLREHLPADTPRVSPAQRRARVAVRQAHVARRFAL